MHTLQRFSGVFLLAMLAGLAVISPTLAQDANEAETVRANVIICADPDCEDTVNIQTMVGATITSYHPDGSEVDSCTVTLTPSDMVDCTIVPAPDRGSYEVWPADEYVGYRLVSSHPEVFQSEMHGPVYVWYFAPPSTEGPVTQLPSTGVGIGNHTRLLAGTAFGLALLGIGATAVRRECRA